MELAYLTDRAGLACHLGIAALRRAGAVRAAPLSTLVADGPPPARSAPLVRALHAATRSPATWSAVRNAPAVVAVLRQLVSRLHRDGWLLSRRQRRAIRLAVVPLYLVPALVPIRLVAGGGRTGGPAAVVGLLFAGAATLLTAWRLSEIPEVGRAGRRLLRRERREHAELAPGRRPRYGERPAGDLLRAMALFGPRPLLTLDPAFAGLVGIQEVTLTPFPGDVRPAPEGRDATRAGGSRLVAALSGRDPAARIRRTR
ncbi:TIGR04222 domain-containing membrane protein [Plantactinospora siamensis]|uniref:TIGR04222 domain-containing membrane protein n=1 Tax=Plantactinospora siamensis TaxID=555372 RepID=A0ABV6P6C3_9ACTN